MGFVKEFREFAMRGNVIDLAVGVIIGGAFGTIVNSMIADVIMPVIGIAGKADFSNLYVGLNGDARAGIAKFEAAQGKLPSLAEARTLGPVLAYGNFITVLINFIILAFCIFLMVKAMNTLKRKQAAAPAVPPAPTPDQVLLTEIRDLLRARA
jgi:large conductance mechanosensitive channel